MLLSFHSWTKSLVDEERHGIVSERTQREPHENNDKYTKRTSEFRTKTSANIKTKREDCEWRMERNVDEIINQKERNEIWVKRNYKTRENKTKMWLNRQMERGTERNTRRPRQKGQTRTPSETHYWNEGLL